MARGVSSLMEEEGEFACGPENRSRQLATEEEVWEHNCWDDVVWNEEMDKEAELVVQNQRDNSIIYQQTKGNLDRVKELQAFQEALACGKKWLRGGPKTEDLESAADKWNQFYNNHERWFFKDRQWLRCEFRELFHETDFKLPDGSSLHFPVPKRIMEVGCGAGNTVFPLWKDRKHERPQTLEHIFACDYSAKAVELVKSFRDFDADHMTAFVHDLSAEHLDFGVFENGSIDAITAIFILSALKPDRLLGALKKLHRALRPGGLLLFRDYGRYDLTQLRLKPDRFIDDDFYFRGDGTTVYFFTLEKLRELAEAAGFTVLLEKNDRRLITNRFRKLKMYRNWIQMKFVKPLDEKWH